MTIETVPPEDLADIQARAELMADEATEPAVRIFYRAAAAVLGDAFKRQREEAFDA
ncbi:hypothetical protein [Oceanicola sp. S124]|uniref:hypothetical protein n=1 Tax=Oceanicola sp. S124 TaxID=1042378 RepID=UPI0002D9DBE4|nr:hypothetical protein [Oceanicola sp. S124]